MSWKSARIKLGGRAFDSRMVDFLKRLPATFFMAVSWVVLALCIHLSPASGADYPAAQPGRHPDARDISIGIGRAAFENGDLDSAVAAFDQALADSPDLPAEGPASDGCSPESGPQGVFFRRLGEALSLNPQQEAESSIGKYLQEINSSKREHFLSARISLGLDLDDEEEATSTARGGGTTASLSDAITVTVERPEKGLKHTSTASFDYLYRPRGSSVSWKFSGMNYVAVYRENKDLDVNLYDFKAGTSVQKSKLTWDIYGTTNHLNRYYGQYLRTYGVGTTLSYVFASCLRLNMDGRLKIKNHFDDDHDARNLSLAVSPKVTVGRSLFSLSIGLEQEESLAQINSYTKINGKATYEVVLPFASNAYVSYWYQGTEYKAPSDASRMDEVRYISTGLTKNIPVWKSALRNLEMNLNIKYVYTRADSNIDLYVYAKNVLSSGMSVVF